MHGDNEGPQKRLHHTGIGLDMDMDSEDESQPHPSRRRLRASRLGLLPRRRAPFSVRQHTEGLQGRPDHQGEVQRFFGFLGLVLRLALLLLPVCLALTLPPLPPRALLRVELWRNARELVLPDGRLEHATCMSRQRAGMATRQGPRRLRSRLRCRRDVRGRREGMDRLPEIQLLFHWVRNILREEVASCCAAGLQMFEDFTISALRNAKEPGVGSTLT